MIVKCKTNSAAEIPEQYLDPRANLDRNTQFPLTPGGAYVVYAIAFRSEQVWLYVEDDDKLYYPLSYPAVLFDVVDARVSRHWHFRQTPGHRDHTAILAIPEWAGDRFFYDRLTDREDRECEVFRAAKQRMEVEAHS